MKRIIFPLIMLCFVAISCNQNSQQADGNTNTSSNTAQDTSAESGFTENTVTEEGKEAPVKQMKADEMRTVSMDGKDLEVTTMYAGSTPKQVFCKTIGREEEARYYFNSDGKVSMLDEIRKTMAGDYIQEIFIYVADSLQVAVSRKAPTKAELEKAQAQNFTPRSDDPRKDAKKTSQKGFVLLVSQE